MNDFTHLIDTEISKRPHGDNCNNLHTICEKCLNEFQEWKNKNKL